MVVMMGVGKGERDIAASEQEIFVHRTVMLDDCSALSGQ